MTTDSGKKPREIKVAFNSNETVRWATEQIDGHPFAEEGTLFREVLPDPDCPNCERLEEMLSKESTFLGVANNGWQFEEQRNKQLQSVIAQLQAQLAMCKEVLEFYADGGNPNRDIWLDEELGYFTGKRARECLFKLKKE